MHAVCESISLNDFIHFSLSLSLVFSALLDIPVYESRIQSLHALFTLYLGFKNSEVKEHKLNHSYLIILFQHFKAMMNVSEPNTRRGGNPNDADQMIID